MKFKTVFVCQKCGYEAPKWSGQCPECGEWNTLAEEVKQQESKKAAQRTRSFTEFSSEIVKLADSKAVKEPRIQTHISEFDRSTRPRRNNGSRGNLIRTSNWAY